MFSVFHLLLTVHHVQICTEEGGSARESRVDAGAGRENQLQAVCHTKGIFLQNKVCLSKTQLKKSNYISTQSTKQAKTSIIIQSCQGVPRSAKTQTFVPEVGYVLNF